ncbi:MAG: hypothetical protein ABIO49_11755 [Dokdonella sp.]
MTASNPHLPSSAHAIDNSTSTVLARCAEWIAADPELAAGLSEIDSIAQFRDALITLVGARMTVADAAHLATLGFDRPAPRRHPIASWPLSSRRGWQPLALEWGASGAELVWGCGATSDDLPFHELTLANVRSRPLNRWFAVRTSLTAEFVAELEADMLPLCGFILHMSRCGSTLIAQTLKAWAGTRVLSEPGVFDTALMAALAGGDPGWLAVRGVLAALRQPAPTERRVVLKLDAWHALALTQLRTLMPGVPWLFAYRDPLEVLASHARESGRHTAPGMLPEAWLGAEPALPLSPIEHAARVLGALCAAVLPHASAKNLVNHCELVEHDEHELPVALIERIPLWFGLDPSEVDHARFTTALSQHAKKQHEVYVDDRVDKREAASEPVHAAAACWIAPHYATLEAIRTGCSSGS